MKYPADNPLARLDALRAEQDAATSRAERERLAERIHLLRNGSPTKRKGAK